MTQATQPTEQELKAFFRGAAERIRNGFSGDAEEWGQLEIDVTAQGDYDVSPTDYDCYSDEDIRRYNNNDWEFVHVRLTISLGSMQIGSAGIGGVDHGLVESADAEIRYLAEHILPDLFREAVAEAPGSLALLSDAVDQVGALSSLL